MKCLGVILLCFVSIRASPVKQKYVRPVPVKDIGPRIVNGEKATLGQFPYQVEILGRSPELGNYFCGGSIIHEEWILTAGHCVFETTVATIYSGTIRSSGGNRTASQAQTFIAHEDYDPITQRNDIGLIKLLRPLVFNDNTKAVALTTDELEAGIEVTVTGWGQVSDTNEDLSDVLNYITLSTMANRECQAIFGASVVQPGLVCLATGNPLKSPCLGDSGAPGVVNASTDPVQVAIFSFVNGYGCEFPYPSGNTRTAYYHDWIMDKIGADSKF